MKGSPTLPNKDYLVESLHFVVLLSVVVIIK